MLEQARLAAHREATVKQKFMLQSLLRTCTGAFPGGLQKHGKYQQSHGYLVTMSPIPHPPTPCGVGNVRGVRSEVEAGKGEDECSSLLLHLVHDYCGQTEPCNNKINLTQCSSFYTFTGLSLSPAPGDIAPAHALPAVTELLSEQAKQEWCQPSSRLPKKNFCCLSDLLEYRGTNGNSGI